MSSELVELVEFLHSPQPAVRQIALENVAPYANSQHSYLFKNDDYRAIRDLKILIHDRTERTVQLALTILVNLCDDNSILDNLAADESLIKSVVNAILTLNLQNTDLFCILLANLAKNDQITRLFGFKRKQRSPGPLQGGSKNPDEAIINLENETFKSDHVMDCLMDCFVKGSERSLNKYADFNFLAFFFSDISRFKEGREYFITEQEYDGVVPITKLLVFTESESRTRRAGAASTIKNSLFNVQAHDKLVKDPSVNLLPYILLPLAGPEDIPEDELFELPDELQLLPPDKKRDADHQILCTHVESLLILCTTKSMREYMREKSVYTIIRELHKNVEDDVVQDPCERLVQMLMRDEEPEAKISEEADDEDGDEIVEIL